MIKVKEPVKRKVGRPSKYSPELADRICAQIANSTKSLRTICKEDGMPSVISILSWLRTNKEFLTLYIRAKEEQADFMVEELLEIADDGSNDFMTVQKGDQMYQVENREWINRSKLRVEARKWIAAKLKPKKYGEKLEVDANVNLTNEPIKFE